MEDVEQRVADALVDVFGDRLEFLAAHGSDVAGDAFPGFSDLDVVAVLGGGLALEAALKCADHLDVDLRPASYLQVAWVDADEPTPSLVPGSFRALSASPYRGSCTLRSRSGCRGPRGSNSYRS